MRIGLLTTSFPRCQDDVPGRFVLGFAQALVSQGAHVEVLAPEPREPDFSEPPRFPGIDVHWVPYQRPRAWADTFYGAGVLDNLQARPTRALGLLPFVAMLARSARHYAHAWDAVVSHWALPCALIAGTLKPRHHLAVLHSADVFLLEQLPLRAHLAARIAQSADQLLFVSRELRHRFLALLAPLARGPVAARSHVCAMGIEPAYTDPAPRQHAQASRTLRVASLGRLIDLKGIANAIEAITLVQNAELRIAGSGPRRAALEQQARTLHAPVRFVGALHGAHKHQFFRAADVFVLPSLVLPSGRSEGAPTAVLEAMDHGLPVVASDVGGVRDLVTDGVNGLLVPPGNVPALAHALLALSHPARRAALAEAARTTAALYHWPVLAPQLYALAC